MSLSPIQPKISLAMISLDGEWEFLHIADDRAPGPAEIRFVQVPKPWQAEFADLRMRAGIGIYRRDIELNQEFLEKGVRIHFGAVFHNTIIFINGREAGRHEGGFLPFSFDISDKLRAGHNEIKVRVDSPTDNPEEFPDSPFAEIPFGKQSWYGPLSGIWQSVRLEQKRPDHIKRIRIRPSLETGSVDLNIYFSRPLIEGYKLAFKVQSPSGELAFEHEISLPFGAFDVEQSFSLSDVFAWSPEHPNLYKIQANLILNDSEAWDTYQESFGFRTIETRNGQFFLNGQPLYIRAALDQDYYPGTICTVPSRAFLEDQFRKTKELGLNTLRIHIKAADPLYYELADQMGLLVWTELPNGGLSTDRSRQRKEQLLKGIVDRDGNHPSIIIWTIINENWGVDLVHDPDHRAWLKKTYHWLKNYDPSRLVVDNSPLAPSFHVETDITDYHFYAAIPDHRASWDKFVDELANRSSWLYSHRGDAVIKGDEPLMCSEFGNWGLPYPKDLRDEQGHEPWWFETGHDWGEGVMYPHGVENRFTDWSLDRVFGDLRRFVIAVQWQQFRALKYQIEAMRRKPQLAGYVITELHDCHWESNGLLDMNRNPRVFHELFSTINNDVVVVPKWSRVSLWSDEPLDLSLVLANGGPQNLQNVRLDIDYGDQRQSVVLENVEPGSVLDLGAFSLPSPDLESSNLRRVNLTLRDAAEKTISWNHVDCAIHPSQARRQDHKTLVWSENQDVLSRMEALGYKPVVQMNEADVIVAQKVDDDIADYVRNGGRMLFLPEKPAKLYPFFPHWQNVNIVPREGTLWMGDWASSFAWLRRSGVFSNMPGGPLLDETFDRIIPDHVMVNCNLLDFQARVFAGLVVGWIHKPVALGVERSYGKGRFVASTFRLFRDEPGLDPAATMMLGNMVMLAQQSRQPRLEEAVRLAEAAA